MDALFGPVTCPTASEVLDRLGARMRELVSCVFQVSRARSISPRQAALLMSESHIGPGKPYGRWQEPPGRSVAALAGGPG